MRPFEEIVAVELQTLLRAEVLPRGVRLTVRELLVTRIERGPIGAREIGEAVEATLWAACRLVRERKAPEDMIETVLDAALEAVRGQGGESARWIAEARNAALAVFEQLAQEHSDEPTWRWLSGRLQLQDLRS
jgi:hypothetical protein